MSKNLLPAGLVPSSKTAAYDALIGKSLEQEQPILDARNQLLKEGIDTHKKIVSQNLIRDMDLVDTGNPIRDAQIRDEMNRDRGMNLYDDKTIKDAMQTLTTQGATDYKTNLDLESKIRGEDHRLWDENTMRMLNSSDPNYMKNLGDAVEYSVKNSINAPALTAEAARVFANTDIRLADNTISDAIIGTGGNITDPKAYNTSAYNAAKKTAVNNMANNNRHIRDRKVFEARFDKMITNHPIYGQKFKLGRADEADKTVDSQKLEGFAAEISKGENDRDPLTGKQTEAGRQAVVSNMNGMLRYMRTNKLEKGDLDYYNDIIIRTLERDPLTSTGIFQKVAKDELEKWDKKKSIWNKELSKGTISKKEYESAIEEYNNAKASLANIQNWEVISTNYQAKAKKYVREYYRGTYSELTDSILTKAYDRIINSGSDSISVATQIGKDNAVYRGKRRKIEADTKQKIYTENLVKLRKIQNDTLPNYLINALGEKLNRDHPDTPLSQNDRTRLRDQTRKLSEIMEDRVGKNLTGENRAAFLLAVERMVLNNVGWDTGSKMWGLNFTDADFSLVDNDEMNLSNHLELMELFHANIPHSDTIAAARGKELKLKKGAETLKKNVGNYVKKLKKLPMTTSFVPGLKGKSGNIQLHNTHPLAFIEEILKRFLPTSVKPGDLRSKEEELKADIQQMGKTPPTDLLADWQNNFVGYLAKMQEDNPQGFAKAQKIIASGSRGKQYSKNPGITSRFNEQ